MGVGHRYSGDPEAKVAWAEYVADHEGVSFQSIAEVILDASAADITFTGIPATYRALRLQYDARCDAVSATENVYAQLNADTGANYDYSWFYTSSATINPITLTAQGNVFIGFCSGASAPAGVSSSNLLWLPNCARTDFNKTVYAWFARKGGTGAGLISTGAISGFWRNSAAITEVRFFPGAGNFIAGTIATLWGIV